MWVYIVRFYFKKKGFGTLFLIKDYIREPVVAEIASMFSERDNFSIGEIVEEFEKRGYEVIRTINYKCDEDFIEYDIKAVI